MTQQASPLQFGRGYLIGRINAYRRGSLSLAHVAGAAALAKRQGLTDADITDILQESGLQWNDTHDAVTTSGESRPN